jgi:hypothetical protein
MWLQLATACGEPVMDTLPVSLDGTIVDGNIQLDRPIKLANNCRVRVTVTPVDEVERKWDEALAGLDSLKREQPIGSGGLKFTREQLHERG